MKDLERERRLDIQRRKELAWKGKKETYKLKKWITEMVVGDLIVKSVEVARKSIIQTCEETSRWLVEISLKHGN